MSNNAKKCVVVDMIIAPNSLTFYFSYIHFRNLLRLEDVYFVI